MAAGEGGGGAGIGQGRVRSVRGGRRDRGRGKLQVFFYPTVNITTLLQNEATHSDGYRKKNPAVDPARVLPEQDLKHTNVPFIRITVHYSSANNFYAFYIHLYICSIKSCSEMA